MPALYGGALLISSAFGCIVLRERMTWLSGAGLTLILLGIACIVTAKLGSV